MKDENLKQLGLKIRFFILWFLKRKTLIIHNYKTISKYIGMQFRPKNLKENISHLNIVIWSNHTWDSKQYNSI